MAQAASQTAISKVGADRIAVVEEVNICSLSPPVVSTCPAQTLPWGNITVPALVVDGALDLLVGEDLASALFGSLGSMNKQLIIFPAIRTAGSWRTITMQLCEFSIISYPSLTLSVIDSFPNHSRGLPGRFGARCPTPTPSSREIFFQPSPCGRSFNRRVVSAVDHLGLGGLCIRTPEWA